MKHLSIALLASILFCACDNSPKYTLEQGTGADYYDKTLSATHFWLDKLYDGWMGSPAKQEIESFDELFKWVCNKVKGIIIWDENVPATINVATTMAGIEDGIVLMAAMAEEFATKYHEQHVTIG